MQAVIVGHDLSEEVRRGIGDVAGSWDRGRYWSLETHYLYTLLWDPLILNRTQSAPVLRESNVGLNGSISSQSILFLAQTAVVADQPVIADVLRHGGRVVLQHPAVELLDELELPATVADVRRPSLISLRERWDLGASSTRAYYYPDQQPFLRLIPCKNSKVLSRIGGNPDLVISNQSAIWAGNALSAAVSYRNMPGVLSQLMGDLATNLVEMIGWFAGKPVAEHEKSRLSKTFELRRDFHALGFAYLTVLELAYCHGREVSELVEVESQATEAAAALVAGDDEDAQRRLTIAFQTLERINRTLQPKPAIFTDTLHGGELYPDIGYFEIDWPQHPADVLQTYLHWAKTRSYRFNVDFGATTVREMALRYPDLFAELKVAQDQQVVEFVNGSCNQPYPPLHSLESQIRQFDVGVNVWKEVFGAPPRTYVSQEFGFCPQIGAVLKQQDYEQAVIRVQNMGDSPAMRDEQIDWIAPSGDRLRSLPSHPHKSEQLNLFTYNNLHMKLYLHQQQKLDFAVFTCLGDITYHRPMREELARVCHYAPVFGRFVTFTEYFGATRHRPVPQRRVAMQDFDYDAGFLNLDLWKIYTEVTGNYNTNCMRSLAATNLFAAAEMLDGIAAWQSEVPRLSIDHDAHWEALTHYQGHGTYIVPCYPSGAFLGGINSPTMRESGRGVSKVAEYMGPFSSRQVKDVTDSLMDTAESEAMELIQHRLKTLTPSSSHGQGFMLYNFSQMRRKVVTLPGAAGQSLHLDGRKLPAQDFESDRLSLIDLPSYGIAFVEAHGGVDRPVPVDDPVSTGNDYLENRTIRAEFDPATGLLRRLLCKSTGRKLLDNGSHAFYRPESGPQRCREVRVISSGSLRGCIEFDIEISLKDQKSFLVRSRAWLDAHQSVIDFETWVLDSVPNLSGDQWHNHLGVRFLLGDTLSKVHTCHFNVLEPHDREQLFSPNVLLAERENGNVVFLNEGNEFYLRQGNSVSNILVVQNEEARRFRYAVGVAGVNPVMQGRIWQQPVIAAAMVDSGPAALRGETTINRISGSLIAFDSPDIELLSCRLTDGVFRVRLANTTNRNVSACMRAFLPIATAELTSLNGTGGVAQSVSDGQVTLSLRPWDIRQLEIRLLPTRSDTASQRKPKAEADRLQKV